MDLDWIEKILKTTLYFTVCLAIFITYFIGIFDGLALLAGGCWGCLNLLFIKNLVQEWIVLESRHYLKILLLLTVKFPILYFFGYLLLASNLFPLFSLLAGCSIIFLTFFFKAFTGAIIKASLFPFLILPIPLMASLDSDVPEVPNIFTLLSTLFSESALFNFLHQWESLIFSIGMATAISLLFYFGTRNKKLIPSGLQNFLESVVEFLRNFVIEVLGPEGEKYLPFIGTLFIYIVCMNWMVLIPFLKAPSSNLNITIALALCVFFYVQYLNIKNFGFLGFLYHMAGSPKDLLGWIMVPLMLPIEILTQLTRPVTLSLRLFGNVVGEDILIGAFALFGVSLWTHYQTPIVFPLQIPFMFLALLTSLMQAFVFALLTTVYILLSMPAHDEEHA